ncbi:MAG: hypothetical protein A2Y40_08200 [Candidatus Margulisbacteria bacterium GWF2_35_9]|nr:MAG: hypothetical protein A2Y40_08200 [Candidatus Margulisbacteria bacterium GWF2_35_9]
MKQLLKSNELCRKTGCSHRQLQYWEQKGYLSPKLGKRNIRYYSLSDVATIRNIIDLKRKGKSLGEAFSQSTQKTDVPYAPSFQIGKINTTQLIEEEWLQKSNELMSIIDEIQNIENSIPRFPYFVYDKDNIKTLKDLQEQAVKIKKQKDSLATNLREVLRIEAQKNEDKLITNPEPIIKKVSSSYTIDQLVIMWIKKNGENDASKVREQILGRLLTGEAPESIAFELNHYPTESKEERGVSSLF